MDETSLIVVISAVCIVGCVDGERIGETGGPDDTGTVAETGPLLDGESEPSDRSDVGTLDTSVSDTDEQSDSEVTTYASPKIWRLEQEASNWTVFADGEGRSEFAPDSPVRAAFDIEHSNFAFVLTETSLHTLHLDNDRHDEPEPVWVEARPLDELGPEIASATILAAHSDPEDSPDDAVAVLGLDGDTPSHWRATYQFDDGSFADASVESVGWTDGDAPDPRDVTVAWRDNDNSRDWFDGEPPCGISPTGSFEAYVGYLTSTRLHLHDVWYCTDYFRKLAFENVGEAPEGMPQVDEIGAAFWHGRELYLIGE